MPRKSDIVKPRKSDREHIETAEYLSQSEQLTDGRQVSNWQMGTGVGRKNKPQLRPIRMWQTVTEEGKGTVECS